MTNRSLCTVINGENWYTCDVCQERHPQIGQCGCHCKCARGRVHPVGARRPVYYSAGTCSRCGKEQ